MSSVLSGIHHVTAIAGPAQRNVDFYVDFLGLRLVKQTVNFDDPGTYHFYYGNGRGQPGSILTFFPWAQAAPGRTGGGMAGATALAVPEGALDYWRARFADAGWRYEAATRFGAPALVFHDPDGLPLALVAGAAAGAPWADGPVAPEHAVHGFAGVTLHLADPEPTARLFTDVFGYTAVGEEEGRLRFETPAGGMGAVVDLVADSARGRSGAGTVHHVAFRVPDEATQKVWQAELREAGLYVTEVKDRTYFQSVYFREPGGVLFELATDPPGFTTDEAPEALGMALKLPPWLEPHRDHIASSLAPLVLPASMRGAAS